MVLILFDMSMPMPPSWIFFFVLGPSLPVTEFSQRGRQDNLCWVPLSLFKFNRGGSHPCTPGMPQETQSTTATTATKSTISAPGHPPAAQRCCWSSQSCSQCTGHYREKCREMSDVETQLLSEDQGQGEVPR